MIKKTRKKMLLMMLLSLVTATTGLAQLQTGSISGTIYDNEGNPLPGVTITIVSESMMGTKSYVTTALGSFRFPAIPHGTYRITAELSGFRTVSRGEIQVSVGKAINVDISMEMSSLEEEVTVTAAPPVVDVQQSKIAVSVDNEFIKNIPISRDLSSIILSAPGSVPSGGRAMTHGSSVRSTSYNLDGVNLKCPAMSRQVVAINFDSMDEVEMITGGHPASVGFTDGAYINVVSKSGGNKFSGSTLVYFTNDDLNQLLWTDENVQSFGVSQPSVDKRWIESSATLGGPIFKDKLWFFASGRFLRRDRSTPFIPFTDPFGYKHEAYDVWRREWMGLFKLTSQITSNLKFTAMAQSLNSRAPITSGSAYGAKVSRTNGDVRTSHVIQGNINYILNQNTFFDARVGYVRNWSPSLMVPDRADLYQIIDYGTPYRYYTNKRFNEQYFQWKIQASAHFTHFKDDFLGGSHEFKGGVEWEDGLGGWDFWRADNMLWYMDTRNPGNYYYGLTDWNGVSDVGRGQLRFYHMNPSGPNLSDGPIQHDRNRRISVYIQDAFTINKRLTLNLGLRYDWMKGFHPETTKYPSGNPLSIYLGEEYVSPYCEEMWPENFPNGHNPFGELYDPGWDPILKFSNLQPRVGLNYDLFGNGRTALKASYGRYSEFLMTQYIGNPLHIFAPTAIRFNWYDMNFNGTPDEDDDYTLYPYDFRLQDPLYQQERVDPNHNSALRDEIIVGVTQELFKNFSLGVNVIYKWEHNILQLGLYNPDSGEYWYHMDQAEAQKYWIPFTTIVPGADDYPDKEVTLYVRANDAPSYYYRMGNPPELERKYAGLELIFNKRMSDGWQFYGSVVYSKAWGNLGGEWGESWGGSSSIAGSPNFFVNNWGRTSTDRPLAIKLMGTAQLPFGILISSYFRHFSGEVWARYANIRPPSSWCDANNAYRDYYGVLLEPVDARRGRSIDELDLRFEKEFMIGDSKKIGLYVDVFNLLGYTNVNVGLDDVYQYNPSGENVSEPGNVTLESSYKRLSSVTGLRTIKFSIRYSF